MASGHVNRVKRPNTWLHRPMLQNVKKVLANPEPSTHDPIRTSCANHSLDHFGGTEAWLSLVARFRVTTAVPPPDAGVGFLYVSSSSLIAMKRF